MPAAERTWAALDLGSNSFHLIIVERQGASFTVVERLKEKVQLLGGFKDGQIQDDAYLRGLACIRRFAQRLADVPREHIRALGTFALREASNSDQFIATVSDILGLSAQVISGEQEAQMVYQAVHWTAPQQRADSRVVIDIGGGSTEVACGAEDIAVLCQSVAAGCVAYKDRFFAPGSSQASGYVRAKQAAVQAMQALQVNLPAGASVFGTSGTIESMQTVLRANGWAWDSITLRGLQNVEADIVEERWLVNAGLPGLSPDRVDIFPAGAAILQACFEVFGIEEMKFVDVSLLHGILYENFQNPDPGLSGASTTPTRAALATKSETKQMSDTSSVEGAQQARASLGAASLQQLAMRFNVDQDQARRVASCALNIFDQCDSWWPEDREDLRRLLGWAAGLHEIGSHINARHYHRHGAYIIKHADIAGMGEEDRSVIALLVRGHRRSLPGLAFRSFAPGMASSLFRLMAILRLAAILERSHADAHSPQVVARAEAARLTLELDEQWLLEHPLAAKELDVEVTQLAQGGTDLHIELVVQSGTA